MACSICGQKGHNAKTCPHTQQPTQARNSALWLKFDHITEHESDELLKASIDAKSKIAPHARGTFAKGKKHELPDRIRQALQLQKTNPEWSDDDE